MSEEKRSLRKFQVLAATVLFAGLLFAAVRFGETGPLSLGELARGCFAMIGIGEGIEGVSQHIFEIRLWRALVAILVGASLALAGALLQGLFRNPLASPSLLGVTGGASFGMSVAVSSLGGAGHVLALEKLSLLPLLIVPCASFVAALTSMFLVLVIGLKLGRGQMGSLLLVGIALSSLWGGLTATVQSFVLDRLDVSRAIISWGLGTLDDRSVHHVYIVGSCLAIALVCLPFLHRELDLFAMGEDDAQTLGVRPQSVKLRVIVLSSLLTAGAVSAAGQIAFVGLIVPNVLRVFVGPSHARLLPLSCLLGAVLLLGIDTLQRTIIPQYNLRPGVLMSLLGAPFFLLLLLRRRGALLAW